MNIKRINFIIDAADSYSFKRIEEFRQMGYEVKAYCCDRGDKKPSVGFRVETIAAFSNDLPYRKRIKLLYSAFRKVLKKTRRDDKELWYYFGLSVAMFACRLNKNKKYLYEESDMAHANLKNGLLRRAFEWLDRRIIRKSLLSLFTSEGFLQFHFGKQANYPNNVILKPNKVSLKIKETPNVLKTAPNLQHLRFAFVGGFRYEAVYNIADHIARNFPQHEFHFYGYPSSEANAKKFKTLETYANVHFHGAFKNPDELPKIYSNIDVVISTYDVDSLNVRYAEPNKLYEALYFRTPIVVSKGTFLEKQVEKYHAGWSVDAMDEQSVCNLVKNIERDILTITTNMRQIPQDEALDSVSELSEKLQKITYKQAN